jgi:hypothetical protein
MLAGSGLDAFTAAAAVDGDVGSNAWHTDTAAAGATLTVDLGASGARAMRRVGVYASAGGYAGVYDVEYSDNGSDWTAALEDVAPSVAGWTRAGWPDVGSHRYWRLRLTNTPGAGPWLNELELEDAVRIAIVPGSTRTFTDQLPQDGGRTWYRGRHLREGWLDGAAWPWVYVDAATADDGKRPPPAVGLDDVLILKRTTPYTDGKFAPLGESDGHLAEGVQLYDGGTPTAIARHLETPIYGRDGDAITFGQAYQNAPLLVLAGLRVRTYDASWTGERILRVSASNVSTAGFDVVAKNVEPGVVTPREDDFPAGNALDAEGETAEATVTDAPANDDAYTAHYDVALTVHALEGGPRTTLTVVVAIDSSASGSGGDWVERATRSYALAQDGWVGPDPGPEFASWTHEQVAVAVSSLTGSSKLRVRVKSVTVTGTGDTTTAVHGFNLATDADAAAGVTYNTATDSVESATPNDEDGVLFLPIEGT